MKAIIKIAIAATLVAGATAQPHAHQHRHAHAKKHEHGSPVALDKRSPAVAIVYETPVVTEYVYEGEDIDAEKAKAGIEAGLYRVVGESTPTFVPPPPPSSTSTSISSSSTLAAQFFEVKSSSTPSPTSTSTPAPASTSASSSSSDTSTGDGLDKEFQDGVHDCANYFPSEYGAVPVDYLGLGGYLSLQQPAGGWTLGVKMNNIVQPTSGDPTPGTFASYRCPDGYGKTQWPADQGATGQSIGGLYCDSDNKLYLSNKDRPKLCMKGAGGVKIVNKLSKVACACQTNYPADEKMSISLCPTPGQTRDMFNPIATESYYWQGTPTSAQWYLNPLGFDAEDACVWLNPNYPDNTGNYAPMNAGTGQDVNGVTYLSIFDNSPSSSAKLDYNVAITGDILGGPCAYTVGEGYSNGGTGCTVTLKKGGTASFVLSN
ncbi:putative septation protein sun4 protein [Phaeoacremonium minimum UCRPA7]|uniref:Putative septation protein sun4 protein n=1 Tax=Phaeoacremonium minimum (strain UCR-PA7) TaxID=1286976 RepID=R8BJZ5_PHAM7|nr:putative septation protein sun4 protein [Phaeoacremonium minimum UCRPA7]EON99678.1 putative septation protein sun4 protein [Phaeoacremonium minimum UCRPA7]